MYMYKLQDNKVACLQPEISKSGNRIKTLSQILSYMFNSGCALVIIFFKMLHFIKLQNVHCNTS